MKRLSVGVLAFALVAVAVVFSQNNPLPGVGSTSLKVEVGERNPWTHLRLNNDPNDFQFLVVSDRTGGHREKIFSRAVEQINLMQPEFVLSVGDLIEGYSTKPEVLAKEWQEFQSFTARLEMPFFYVPGNHDVSNPYMAKLWTEKFGRLYYHFVYRGVLFLVLNSDDPPSSSSISAEQVAYIEKALKENADVRWTIVALHKPIWAESNLPKNGWLEVEKLLAGRNYTVFAGHVHRYQKFVRNGMNYYQLATTGGGSRLRGVRYGEFDHVVWVTMKPNGPVLANVMLDGIHPEDLRLEDTVEPGTIPNRKACHPVKGTVYVEGVPAIYSTVVFYLKDPVTKRLSRTGDALVEPDGSFVMSTYASNDGAPAGDYVITVVQGHYSLDERSQRIALPIPQPYGKTDTSPLTATVKSGTNEIALELRK